MAQFKDELKWMGQEIQLEIELPDGTILEAPEGSDIRAVVRGYNIAKLKSEQPAEYDPTSPQFNEKYGANPTKLEAFQSGLNRMNEGTGNILKKTLGSYNPLLPMVGRHTSSNEELQAFDELDREIKERRPISRLGGEAVGSIPLTLASGGAAAASTGGRILTRTLGHPTVRAALEGILPAAATADPNEQAEGGGTGAAVSAVLERFFKGGGRAIKGLVQKSQAMKDLQALFAQHGEEIDIPLSQAAGDQDIVTRVTKTGYQEGLSLIPGVKGKLTRQSEEALARVRELALKEAAPTGARLPAQAGKNVGEAVHSIADSFKTEYADTVGKHVFKLPKNLPSALEGRIRQNFPKIDDTSVNKVMRSTISLMKRFSSGQKTIEGSNLINVRDELTRMAAKAPEFEREAYEVAIEGIEQMIRKGLPKDAAARFSDIAEPERQFKGILKAAHAARNKGGNFSMDQLATHSTDPTQALLASTAGDVFREPAAKSSLTGRILAGVGIGGYGAFIDPATAVGTFIGGNALATKTAQRALMGDTKAQRTLAEIAESNPDMVAQVQRLLRQVSAAQAGESDGTR